MSFNLLDERWIPVIRGNGSPDRVGIRAALAQAAEIRTVCAASPLDTVALYRFLLAVLQWCRSVATEEERNEVRTRGGFKALLEKLDEHKGRFELLGEGHGFYQDPKAPKELLARKQQRWDRDQEKKRAKQRTRKTQRSATAVRPIELTDEDYRPATDLLPELPSGTSVAHFRHTRDKRDGLCPACCALGLIRLSAFATAAKHGKKHQKPAGINSGTPVYALPVGETLLDTLLLNWPMPAKPHDRPGWLSDEPLDADRIGCLAAFTWRPRRVWLDRPKADAPKDRCTYCASDQYPLIRRIAFLPGWPRPFGKEPSSEDPHLLIRVQEPEPSTSKRAKPKPKRVPVTLPRPSNPVDVHAAQWRKAYWAILQAFVLDEPTAQHVHLRHAVAKARPGHAVVVTCIGPAAEVGRTALYKDAAALTWQLPAAQLTKEAAATAIAQLHWLDGLNASEQRSILKKAIHGGASKRPEVTAALANAAVSAETRLREHFEDLVKALAVDHANAVRDWREEAEHCLAEELREACHVIRRGSTLRRQEQEVAVNAGFRHAVTKPRRPEGKEVNHEPD